MQMVLDRYDGIRSFPRNEIRNEVFDTAFNGDSAQNCNSLLLHLGRPKAEFLDVYETKEPAESWCSSTKRFILYKKRVEHGIWSVHVDLHGRLKTPRTSGCGAAKS